jgi:hypothetical protein
MMIGASIDEFLRNPFSRPGQPGAEQRDDEHGATLGRRRRGPAGCGEHDGLRLLRGNGYFLGPGGGVDFHGEMNQRRGRISAATLRRRLAVAADGNHHSPADGARGARAVGMADIFVSYTSSDRDWAFWIAKELQTLGHAPHVHEWEIKGGADIYAWMETRHDAADHVLCVVSDEYLKAPYSTLERHAALWQAAAKRPGFVLFVAAKPCKLPTLSDHIRRCELYGVPEDAARIRFREFMSKREAPPAASFPGKVFAVSNIPIRVPEHFMGRDDALAAIEKALKRYEGRVAITALHGLRGVGKTALAATYAERHHEDYRATWWIRAQTEATMRADLVALGVRLGWVAPDEKEEPALAAVMERLRHEGRGRPAHLR